MQVKEDLRIPPVNIAIHILNAFFLFLRKYPSENPPPRDIIQTDDVYFISLLSAVLWAVNPIQIQAVTYIVQRMTTHGGHVLYPRNLSFIFRDGRQLEVKIQLLFYSACFFSFVSALMSKENAAMMPVSLFLIEIIFFEITLSLKCS